MRVLFTICLALVGLTNLSYAQTIPQNPNQVDKKGWRQGKWTILYDKDWNIIQESANAQFYRLITYKDDKPIGKVYDMYGNGKIQMETTLIADRPQDVMNGETIFYTEDGKKQKIQIFEKGVLVDENMYKEDGSLLIEKWQFLDSMGVVYQKQRHYQLAGETFNRAKLKAAKEFGKRHINYAVSLKKIGDLYMTLGKYAEAEGYFLEALQLQKELKGENNEEYAKNLKSLALNYYYMGNFTKTEALWKEALKIYQTLFGENNINYAGLISNLGVLNYERGNYKQAETYYLQALAIREKLVGKNHPDYAASLTTLGNLYNSRNNYEQARQMHEQAAEIYKTHNDPFYSNALSNIAISYIRMINYPKADSVYQKVLPLSKQTYGIQHPNYAQTLMQIGELYILMYRFEQAKTLLMDAMKIISTTLGTKHSQYAKSLTILSRLYVTMGDHSKAEESFKQILQTYKDMGGEKSRLYSQTLGEFATFYLRIDNYAQAESLFLECLKLEKEIDGVNNINYAGYLSNLGVLYYNVDNYTKAEQCYQEALKIRANLLGKNHPDYAASLITLANLYISRKKADSAEPLLQEVLNIYQSNNQLQTIDYSTTLGALGKVYLMQKKYPLAKEFFIKNIDEIKKLLGDKVPVYAYALNNLAILYQAQKEYSQSGELLQESINITEKTLGTKHVNYNTYICNLAINQYSRQDYEAAFKLCQESAKTNLARIERTFPTMSNNEKNLFLQDIKKNTSLYTNVSSRVNQKNPQAIGWLYDFILATKAILFNNQNKIRNRILSSKDSTLKKLYQTWQSKRNTLAQVYQMSVEEKKLKGIEEDKLEEEVNQLEKDISKASELFAKKNEDILYTWQDVQKKLKKGEVAIEIIRFEVYTDDNESKIINYAALIITPDTKKLPQMLVLENGDELEGKQLNIYQNSIKLKREDKTSYENYWQKINNKIRTVYKAKKVYFSPDGVYNQINLNTLQNPQTGKFLQEELEIQILSNTKDLITHKKNQRILGEKGVFIGYPDYNNEPKKDSLDKNDERSVDFADGRKLKFDSLQRFFDGQNITELLGTKVEVENIKAIFQKNQIQTQTYMAQEASESLIKSLQSPQILHIATHGLFLQNVDNEEVVDERGFMGIDNQKVVENPLLRSGLLFAGASQVLKGTAEDGILTAYEASNLDLDNTELVVMSACETGLGEVQNGEGVYGLQRAFQVAGAKTVLMSLWTVSDEATKDLMTLFYENWITKNQTKREALNNAQNSLKKKFPQPYYWGAFVMVGE